MCNHSSSDSDPQEEYSPLSMEEYSSQSVENNSPLSDDFDPQEEYSPLSVEKYSPQSVEDNSPLSDDSDPQKENSPLSVEEYSPQSVEDYSSLSDEMSHGVLSFALVLQLGKMEDLLYVKDYYLPVFAEQKPEDKTDDKWTILHRQVYGYIRQWVDDNIYNHVSEETHARSLWNKLEQLYAQKTGNNKSFLIKKLLGLKFRDGTPLSDHLNAYQGILN
ncbi:hypothetical protein LWI29_002469 [Acer saccharum]|uniref:Uncharacterized protein n=1 Tax=Acer saccharum TaxID=4024 RepID=A0AA39VQL9_ACESA|nr:hypothetical protein LWI29_002469 [Acer saccharum]